MNIFKPLLAVAVLGALLCALNSLAVSQVLVGKVVQVYDGDTINVENIGKVRLIGIDTPEWQSSDRDQYYLRQGISAAKLREISAASRKYVAMNTLGQLVELTTDREEFDRHGRLLAYVHLSDGRLLNRVLLEEGLAVVYRRFDFDLKADFIQAEEMAHLMFRGLWIDLKP